MRQTFAGSIPAIGLTIRRVARRSAAWRCPMMMVGRSLGGGRRPCSRVESGIRRPWIHTWDSWQRTVPVLLDGGSRQAHVTIHFHWSPGAHCGKQVRDFNLSAACEMARRAGHTGVDVKAIWAATAYSSRGFNVSTGEWHGFDFRYFNRTLAQGCPSIESLGKMTRATRSTKASAIVVPVGPSAYCGLADVLHTVGRKRVPTRLVFARVDPLRHAKDDIGVFLASKAAEGAAAGRTDGDAQTEAYFIPFGVELDHLVPRPRVDAAEQGGAAPAGSLKSIASRVRAASIYYDERLHPTAPYSRIAAAQVLLAAIARAPQVAMAAVGRGLAR